jgi:hypothetical protein
MLVVETIAKIRRAYLPEQWACQVDTNRPSYGDLALWLPSRDLVERGHPLRRARPVAEIRS